MSVWWFKGCKAEDLKTSVVRSDCSLWVGREDKELQQDEWAPGVLKQSLR